MSAAASSTFSVPRTLTSNIASRALRGMPTSYDDLVAAPEQLLRQPAAEESRRAGDEGFHLMRSATSWATSVGVVPTSIPRASSASFFACAVPDEPEMIAPAWPIVLPGGALKPAM